MDEGFERAVCVFVRALSNERVRADKCFGSISPSPPPPPPVNRAGLAALKAALLQRQVRRGGSSGPTAAHAVTNEEEYATESEKHTASQLSYLDALAEDNVQLRGVLDGIRATVHAAGRRLWQRTDDAPSHALVDNILQTAAFGADPIIGITAAECEALCAALDGAAASACQGIAFARATANPRDLALRQCILLKDIGGCSPASFAGAVFARRDTNVKRFPTHSNLAPNTCPSHSNEHSMVKRAERILGLHLPILWTLLCYKQLTTSTVGFHHIECATHPALPILAAFPNRFRQQPYEWDVVGGQAVHLGQIALANGSKRCVTTNPCDRNKVLLSVQLYDCLNMFRQDDVEVARK